MSQLGEDLTNIIASFNELGPGVPASDRVCQALLAVLTTQWQQTHDCGVETPWVYDEEAQKEYELLLFPNERHSPRSLDDRVYMEQRVLAFLQKALA